MQFRRQEKNHIAPTVTRIIRLPEVVSRHVFQREARRGVELDRTRHKMRPITTEVSRRRIFAQILFSGYLPVTSVGLPVLRRVDPDPT